jgi:hypothetical protein
MEKRNVVAIDWINLVLAVLLIASPWVLAFPAGTVTYNAVIAGLIIGIVAIAALSAFAQWEEWVNLVLGVWVIVSPFVLHFTTDTRALWTHVVIGLVVAVLAAIELWTVARPPAQMASH